MSLNKKEKQLPGHMGRKTIPGTRIWVEKKMLARDRESSSIFIGRKHDGVVIL